MLNFHYIQNNILTFTPLLLPLLNDCAIINYIVFIEKTVSENCSLIRLCSADDKWPQIMIMVMLSTCVCVCVCMEPRWPSGSSVCLPCGWFMVQFRADLETKTFVDVWILLTLSFYSRFSKDSGYIQSQEQHNNVSLHMIYTRSVSVPNR